MMPSGSPGRKSLKITSMGRSPKKWFETPVKNSTNNIFRKKDCYGVKINLITLYSVFKSILNLSCKIIFKFLNLKKFSQSLEKNIKQTKMN